MAKEMGMLTKQITELRHLARSEQDHMDYIAKGLQLVMENMTLAKEYAETTLERTSSTGDLDPEGPYQVFNELAAKDAARFALEEKQGKLDMIAASSHTRASQFDEHLADVFEEIKASVASSSSTTGTPPALASLDEELPVERLASPSVSNPRAVESGGTSLLQVNTKNIADEIEEMVRNDLKSKQKPREEEMLETQRDEQERHLADILRRRATLEDQEEKLRDRVDKLHTALDYLARRRKSMETNYRYLLHFATYVGNDRRWTHKDARHSDHEGVKHFVHEGAKHVVHGSGDSEISSELPPWPVFEGVPLLSSS